jgi:hypothetical protein
MPWRIFGILVSRLSFPSKRRTKKYIDEDARPQTSKLFSKWIPGLGERLKSADEEKKSNGFEAIAA